MSRLKKIQEFIGMDLAMFCDENYGEKYGDLFRNELSKELNEILSTCKHNKDNRTLLQYGQDLLLGWILEDFIKSKLEEDGSIKVEKTGADAERVFLSNKYVTSDADLKLEINTKNIVIEIIADYGNFWKNTGKAHLRDNKILKLLENIEDTYLLAIDVMDSEFQYIPIDDSNSIKHIENHRPWGGKSAYEVTIDRDKFIEINKLLDSTMEL